MLKNFFLYIPQKQRTIKPFSINFKFLTCFGSMILERLIHILIPLFYPIRLAVIPLENTQMRLILKRFLSKNAHY